MHGIDVPTEGTERNGESGAVLWARDIDPVPVEWVLDGRVPRGVVTLVAGPRNAGKTLVTAWLAVEANQHGAYVWVNSLEDDLASVLRPRFEVAGASMDRTRLSAVPFRFPEDLERFAAELRRHKMEGMADDLVILDALQRHCPNYARAEVASVAMGGLKAIAQDFKVGIVFVAHFVKGHGATVEQAIGGAGVVQNLSKAIFVIGPHPRTQEDRVAEMFSNDELVPRRVLACERMGLGPTPDSLVFELTARRYEPTDRGEPFLRCLGPAKATAREVLEAIRREAEGPGADESKQNQAAAWMVATLATTGPIPTKRLVQMAKEAGTHFSATIFDRARTLAQAEAIHPSRLREFIGPRVYAALPEEDRGIYWIGPGWSGAPIPPEALSAPVPTPQFETEGAGSGTGSTEEGA